MKIINTHNIEVIRKYYDQLENNSSNNSNNCNCKYKIDCPMNGIGNLKNRVSSYYFTKGKCKRKERIYIGISLVRWKLRYNNHIHSFSHEHLRNQIALSKHVNSKNSMENIQKIYYS